MRKLIVSVLLMTTISLLSGAVVAHAIIASGASQNSGYICGINYSYFSEVEAKSGQKVNAWTVVCSTNATTPVGYVGYRSYMCYPNGNTYGSNSWYYNPSSRAAWSWFYYGTEDVVMPYGTSWTSWGYARFYDGSSGYYEYRTSISPYVTVF